VFVDNPVGAGFSYVDDPSAYTHNVQDIANDLFTWAKDFFGTKHPEYQTRPFYIFCESYGGKMSAAFAKTLQDVSICLFQADKLICIVKWQASLYTQRVEGSISEGRFFYRQVVMMQWMCSRLCI
jgi:carboxypeptidase C (cathepsin A)